MARFVYSANATFTWPAAATQARVICRGEGGEGGISARGEGGGGGGAYSEALVTKTHATAAVVVQPAVGGHVSFSQGGTVNVLAQSGANASTRTGGAGGLASLGTGTIKFSGGNGATSTGTDPQGGGGGGGAAKAEGDGTAGQPNDGVTGGAGGLGPTGRPSGGNAGNAGVIGTPGALIGGGGGGGGSGDPSGFSLGGIGRVVIICPPEEQGGTRFSSGPCCPSRGYVGLIREETSYSLNDNPPCWAQLSIALLNRQTLGFDYDTLRWITYHESTHNIHAHRIDECFYPGTGGVSIPTDVLLTDAQWAAFIAEAIPVKTISDDVGEGSLGPFTHGAVNDTVVGWLDGYMYGHTMQGILNSVGANAGSMYIGTWKADLADPHREFFWESPSTYSVGHTGIGSGFEGTWWQPTSRAGTMYLEIGSGSLRLIQGMQVTQGRDEFGIMQGDTIDNAMFLNESKLVSFGDITHADFPYGLYKTSTGTIQSNSNAGMSYDPTTNLVYVGGGTLGGKYYFAPAGGGAATRMDSYTPSDTLITYDIWGDRICFDPLGQTTNYIGRVSGSSTVWETIIRGVPQGPASGVGSGSAIKVPVTGAISNAFPSIPSPTTIAAVPDVGI